MHEASLYYENVFVTLTYADENLPYGETLHRPHMQNFIKRMRKKNPNLRFYYCGEYGEETNRPHYHALLFNYRPRDAELISRKGDKEYFRSDYLDKTWSHGHCNFSEVTMQSACYTAGYVTKKIGGDKAEEHYRWIDQETGEIVNRTPEFQSQSLRPGIGHDWIMRFMKDVYPSDTIIVDGTPMQPPRYYDQLCEKHFPELWRETRRRRLAKFARKDPDQYYGSGRQMFAKNKITLSKQRKRDLK